MKKTILSLALCAMCAGASAQTVTVADVEALPGETVAFTLNLTDGKADTYTALQFDVQFPATGFTTTGDYTISPLWKNATAEIGMVNSNGIASIPVSSSQTISTADVEGLLTVAFTVSNDITLGDYDVTLKDLWFGYGTNSKDYLDDVTFKVKVVAVHTIILDENATTMPEASDDAVNVRVKRTIHANEWSTICLPFAMTGTQVVEAFGNDAQLAVFSDWESVEDDDENIVGINICFGSVDPSYGIEANKPLLIYVSSPVTEFTADNVIIDPEEEPSVMIKHGTKKRDPESYMIGTYQAETLLENFSLFLYGNKFYYSVGKTKMQAYRAFFNIYDILSDVENAYADVKMAIDINGIADSVEGLNNDQGARDSECYDLSGRHISTPQQRGVYVVNGHKVLVR